MITEYRLTTIDNPYNPFTQYDEWYAFDEGKGYGTCSYLSRIARISPELDEEDEIEEINRAIDEILSLNLLGIYRKVSRDNFNELKEETILPEGT